LNRTCNVYELTGAGFRPYSLLTFDHHLSFSPWGKRHDLKKGK
jgi:hypothetical protein